MITRDNLQQIRSRYGGEYLLRQLAEECAELSTAALHHIRAKRRETDKTPENTMKAMMEEMADVAVMLDCVRRSICTDEQRTEIDITIEAKANRMVRRLLGGDDDE